MRVTMRMTMRMRVSSEARRVDPGTALLLLLGLIGAVGGLVGCERLGPGPRPVDVEPPPPEVQLLAVLAAPAEVPGDLAWDGEALWVTDVAGEVLHRVSPVDGRVLAQVRLPGLGVLALGVAWDGEALWVAMPLDEALYRLDPSSGRVLARLRLPEAVTDPRGLTWAWDEAGRALWLLDGAAGLLQLDPRDGRVLQRRAVPADDPQGLAWDGERFWLVARERGRLERVTPLGEVEAAWPLPPPVAAPAGLVWTGALAPGRGELWLSDEANGALFGLRVPEG